MSFDGRLLAGITVLAAVVQGRSFVRAGEALGITTSGVSRSIARLEERLGIRLLDRTPRSVALTDEGKRFYEQVGPLLSTIEDAANSASGSAGAVQGRLRVDIDPYFSRLILSGKIGSFLAMHPDLVLEMVTREHVSDLVADGDRFLLCSDGLYSALSEAQMARCLQYDTPEEACRALVESACEAGAPDNVTAVVVAVRSLEQP